MSVGETERWPARWCGPLGGGLRYNYTLSQTGTGASPAPPQIFFWLVGVKEGKKNVNSAWMEGENFFTLFSLPS